MGFFSSKSIILCMFFVSLPGYALASSLNISNGMNASSVIGQYGDDLLTGSFTKSALNNGPNKYGLNTPQDIFVDSVERRLFVAEQTNNRIIVYNLDSNNILIDDLPDFVIGQVDFNTRVATSTQSGMNGPFAVLYDSVDKKLFVGDNLNNRVLVFDLTNGITNGMNASYVLGQPDFLTNTTGSTQSKLNRARSLAYDKNRKLLFVAEPDVNRVKVFDLSSGITSGMDASYVLGQIDFTSGGASITQSGLRDTRGLYYDTSNNFLFVAQDFSANRISVFDLSGSITNGMDASYVLGQPDFVSSTPLNTQSGINRSVSVSYSDTHELLFVTEWGGNRIKIFDLSDGITNGMNASFVLGQSNFSSSSAGISQNTLNQPRGVFFDNASNQLYVTDTGNNRIVHFDLSQGYQGLSNGMNASGVIGQYNDNLSDNFTKNGPNNGPSINGFNSPRRIIMDKVNHRLFLSDDLNNRVLVYNLDSQNRLLNKTPDYVLGQPDFNTSTALLNEYGLVSPRGLGYDSVNNRLFVVQLHRVSVFELSGGITNGMNASYVLGQADFVTHDAANTQSSLNQSFDGYYDEDTQRLFVSEQSGNRIKVFDLSGGITNGMDASYVLGQPDFTSSSGLLTQSGLIQPIGIGYDTNNKLLFAAQISPANRISVFDLSGGITNGMDASYVLGQADFTSGVAGDGASGLRGPQEVEFNQENELLFVADTAGNRVKIFDLSNGITSGMNASYVLGQADFTGSTAGVSQSRMNGVRGLTYDDTSKKLYVVDQTNNRVLMYNFGEEEGDPEDEEPVIDPPSSTPTPATSNTSGQRTAVSSPTLSMAEIQKIFGSLIQPQGTTTAPAPQTPKPTAAQPQSFTRNLQLNSRGEDVRNLQKFLNQNGFTISTSGAGSPGSETTLFGPATRRALIRYQQTKKIAPAVGFFGPVTRGFVNGR
jgi:DNA-binding beta-propeller fold protein YncE